MSPLEAESAMTVRNRIIKVRDRLLAGRPFAFTIFEFVIEMNGLRRRCEVVRRTVLEALRDDSFVVELVCTTKGGFTSYVFSDGAGCWMLRLTDPGLEPDLESLLRHQVEVLQSLAKPGVADRFEPYRLLALPQDYGGEPTLARKADWWYRHHFRSESIKGIARNAFSGQGDRRKDVYDALDEVSQLLGLMEYSFSPVP
jgi:hypothetical protein